METVYIHGNQRIYTVGIINKLKDCTEISEFSKKETPPEGQGLSGGYEMKFSFVVY